MMILEHFQQLQYVKVTTTLRPLLDVSWILCSFIFLYFSISVFACIWLVLRWVTVRRYTASVCNQPLNSPFVYGGLTALGVGILPISFFRIVSKLLDFMTLLGHLFPKYWFKFCIDVL